MTYKKIKYEGEKIICAEREDGSRVYIEPETGELWRLARSGALGNVEEYVPPPPPTEEELLQAKRAAMRIDLVLAKLAMSDAGVFSACDKASKSASERWQIIWGSGAGISLHRMAPDTLAAARVWYKALKVDGDFDVWLDGFLPWVGAS